MDNKGIQPVIERKQVSWEASTKAFDTLSFAVEKEYKRLGNATSSLEATSFTAADGKMRDLVVSLGRVGLAFRYHVDTRIGGVSIETIGILSFQMCFSESI